MLISIHILASRVISAFRGLHCVPAFKEQPDKKLNGSKAHLLAKKTLSRHFEVKEKIEQKIPCLEMKGSSRAIVVPYLRY